MYSETYAHKKISTGKGILYVAAIVLIILLLSILGNMLAYLTSFGYFDLVIYLIVIVGGVLIIRQGLQDYVYIIQDGQLIFERLIGARNRQLNQVEAEDVLWLGRISEMPNDYGKIKIKKATFEKRTNAYIVLYQRNNKVQGIVFSPTDVYLSRLNDLLKKNKDKQYCDKQDRNGNDSVN